MPAARRGVDRPAGLLSRLAGLLGELLITAGAVLILFVAWQLLWTDVVADAEMDEAVAGLEESFDSPDDPDSASLRTVRFGEAFAIMRIPRFSQRYARPVYEGTTREVLMQGIGHYTSTALPGELGNFSVAGHRTTYGKPFNKIDTLRIGDAIIVETRESWFVYRVTSTEIVAPTQTSVTLPVPGDPGAQPTSATLTMTSCHPEFSSRERYVAHALLESTYPRAEGLPASAVEVSG